MDNAAVSNNSRTANQANEQARTVLPPVDVLENKDELLVLVELPGVKKDDVAIHVDKEQLTIEGKRSTASASGSALVTEYRALNFRRQFVITPGSVDVDKITADLQNGVLRLTLPKAARMKPRTIAVTSG